MSTRTDPVKAFEKLYIQQNLESQSGSLSALRLPAPQVQRDQPFPVAYYAPAPTPIAPKKENDVISQVSITNLNAKEMQVRIVRSNLKSDLPLEKRSFLLTIPPGETVTQKIENTERKYLHLNVVKARLLDTGEDTAFRERPTRAAKTLKMTVDIYPGIRESVGGNGSGAGGGPDPIVPPWLR